MQIWAKRDGTPGLNGMLLNKTKICLSENISYVVGTHAAETRAYRFRDTTDCDNHLAAKIKSKVEKSNGHKILNFT